MSALDDLLSPERLRARWEQSEEVEEAPPPTPTALQELGELVRQLAERYDRPREEPMRELCQRLVDLLARGAESSDEIRAELRGDVLTLLVEIEDLAQAFDVGRRGR